jgi:NSS family neurotransmitter:Na+ symporter
MSQTERGNFASKIGIILATAGSAVGLGNVWRFPYLAGENGGAVFIIIYFACVLLLGIPCMLSEFIIGRHAQSNTARAYRKMSGGTAWTIVGFMGVLTGFLITGYYAVVSGWCLQYMWASVVGHMSGEPAYFQQYFTSFTQSGFKPLIWLLVIMSMTFFIVRSGVQSGIERASKVLMPTLFILLLIIVVASCMLPNAEAGILIMLKPDWSSVTHDVFLSALGQSFYSLSIAMGCLCTYASYFTRKTNLSNSAIQISVIDLFIAILAGLMIFPAAFSVGVRPDSGPSLIFITLPNVFQQAFGASQVLQYSMSLMFYSLLTLAALTSLMTLVEVATAFCHEELKISRRNATLLVVTSASLIGVFCSLSLSGYDGLTVLGMSLFDLFDFVTGQIFLPIVGFLTCIFIGWVVPRKVVYDEFTNDGTLRDTFFRLFLFLVRFVCPLCILAIFLHQLGVF